MKTLQILIVILIWSNVLLPCLIGANLIYLDIKGKVDVTFFTPFWIGAVMLLPLVFGIAIISRMPEHEIFNWLK